MVFYVSRCKSKIYHQNSIRLVKFAHSQLNTLANENFYRKRSRRTRL